MSEGCKGPVLLLFQGGGVVFCVCYDVLGCSIHDVFVVLVFVVVCLWYVFGGL